jgi:hypothetical protein
MHVVFTAFVLVAAVVRIALELLRAACVWAAYRRMQELSMPLVIRCGNVEGGSQLHWLAELVGTSVLSPLLFVASPAEFTVRLLQRSPTPADFAFRTVHAGLLSSLPLLFINTWYVLKVAQYGVAPAGWLSLMKGLVFVPHLLFQAFRATRAGAARHHRGGGIGNVGGADTIDIVEVQLESFGESLHSASDAASNSAHMPAAAPIVFEEADVIGAAIL